MSSRPRRRVSLPTGKTYHFNVIYNNAKSKLSKTPDTELSLKVTEYFIGKAKEWGYDSSYYVDRDALPGQNIFTELFQVIDSSVYTIVILTPGFLSNCWARYCQLSAFKSLLDSNDSNPASSASKMIPILIGINEQEILKNLSLNRYVSFTTTDWGTDIKEWKKVQMMMKDITHIPGQTDGYRDVHQSTQQPIQETGAPGSTSLLRISQQDNAPSLSQFNRSLETDEPRLANASATNTHGHSSQRERSQRKEGERSDNSNTQQVTGGKSPVAARSRVVDKSSAVGKSSAVKGSSAVGKSSAVKGSSAVGKSSAVEGSSAVGKSSAVGRSSAVECSSAKGGSSTVGKSSAVGRPPAMDGSLALGGSSAVGNVAASLPQAQSSVEVQMNNQRKKSERSQQATAGETSAFSQTSAASQATLNTGHTKNTGSKSQEQDLLRREIVATQPVIQATQTTTTYSSLPDQRFISSPTTPPGPIIKMPPKDARNVNVEKQLEKVIRLESQNLSNDLPTTGQTRSSKVIPPDDISGELSQNPPLSDEETYEKQVADTVSTTVKSSSKNTVTSTSDSGLGSSDTTPSPSLDPYSAMSYQFGESLSSPQKKRETTFTNQMSAPPITQLTSKNRDDSRTLEPQLPSSTADSQSKSNVSSIENAATSEIGESLRSDRKFDSIGSMQNQSDLDFDHGSFPSGDGPKAVTEEKSEKDTSTATPQKGDISGQVSAREDDTAQSITKNFLEQRPVENAGIDSEHSINASSLSRSTNPVEEEEDLIVNKKKQLSSEKEAILQTLSKVDKDDSADPRMDSMKQTDSMKSEDGKNLNKEEENKLKSSAKIADIFKNGKPRTRRASMSELARPAMNFLGNWMWKPALHVINGADQLYF